MRTIQPVEPIDEVAEQTTYRLQGTGGLTMMVLGTLIGTSHIPLHRRSPEAQYVQQQILKRCPAESGYLGQFSTLKTDENDQRFLEVNYVVLDPATEKPY